MANIGRVFRDGDRFLVEVNPGCCGQLALGDVTADVQQLIDEEVKSLRYELWSTREAIGLYLQRRGGLAKEEQRVTRTARD
jgi:hypothetical protein